MVDINKFLVYSSFTVSYALMAESAYLRLIPSTKYSRVLCFTESGEAQIFKEYEIEEYERFAVFQSVSQQSSSASDNIDTTEDHRRAAVEEINSALQECSMLVGFSQMLKEKEFLLFQGVSREALESPGIALPVAQQVDVRKKEYGEVLSMIVSNFSLAQDMIRKHRRFATALTELRDTWVVRSASKFAPLTIDCNYASGSSLLQSSLIVSMGMNGDVDISSISATPKFTLLVSVIVARTRKAVARISFWDSFQKNTLKKNEVNDAVELAQHDSFCRLYFSRISEEASSLDVDSSWTLSPPSYENSYSNGDLGEVDAELRTALNHGVFLANLTVKSRWNDRLIIMLTEGLLIDIALVRIQYPQSLATLGMNKNKGSRVTSELQQWITCALLQSQRILITEHLELVTSMPVDDVRDTATDSSIRLNSDSEVKTPVSTTAMLTAQSTQARLKKQAIDIDADPTNLIGRKRQRRLRREGVPSSGVGSQLAVTSSSFSSALAPRPSFAAADMTKSTNHSKDRMARRHVLKTLLFAARIRIYKRRIEESLIALSRLPLLQNGNVNTSLYSYSIDIDDKSSSGVLAKVFFFQTSEVNISFVSGDEKPGVVFSSFGLSGATMQGPSSPMFARLVHAKAIQSALLNVAVGSFVRKFVLNKLVGFRIQRFGSSSLGILAADDQGSNYEDGCGVSAPCVCSLDAHLVYTSGRSDGVNDATVWLSVDTPISPTNAGAGDSTFGLMLNFAFVRSVAGLDSEAFSRTLRAHYQATSSPLVSTVSSDNRNSGDSLDNVRVVFIVDDDAMRHNCYDRWSEVINHALQASR